MANQRQLVIRRNFSEIQELIQKIRKECKKKVAYLQRQPQYTSEAIDIFSPILKKELDRVVNEYKRKIENIEKYVDVLEETVTEALNDEFVSEGSKHKYLKQSTIQKLNKLGELLRANATNKGKV